jgi:hypothetical protein
MGQVVLLVVAAAWAAVLLPPLLRNRLENRPNSSVLDFRNQLSSLQRVVPGRGVSVRSMGRSLAPSMLSRPAAPGRPGTRSTARANGVVSSRMDASAPMTRPGRRDSRMYEATLRPRQHGSVTGPRAGAGPGTSRAAEAKRRRANVLFLLVLTTVCAGFLAATTDSKAMVILFAIALAALGGFVYLLVMLNQQGQYSRQTRQPMRTRQHDPYEQAPPPQRRRSSAYADSSGYEDDLWEEGLPARRPPQRQRPRPRPSDDYLDETRYSADSYGIVRPAYGAMPGSGESGRISYGRGATQSGRRDPRDRYGRETYAWDSPSVEVRRTPARNGRHATGQVPVQRRLRAVRDDYSNAG